MNYQAQMIRIISLIMAWGVLSHLSGCSWMTGSFEDPDVKLLKVEVVKAHWLKDVLVMSVDLDNPHVFRLTIHSLQYAVQLNDIQLAEGESGQWFTVPAHGHEVFDVPVRTNLWRHMKYIVKLLERPEEPIRYRLQGEVKTGLMFGRSVHLRRNGEIIPGDFIPE